MKLTNKAIWPCSRAGARGAGAPALAEDSIYVPLFTYRTGPFAGSGTPIADGMHDYLAMLNERDGGIGGVKLVVDECETGYDTKKGLECYDTVKPKNPVDGQSVVDRHHAVADPKAAVDKIPVLSMAYGLSAAARWATCSPGSSIRRTPIGTACRDPQIYRRQEGAIDKLKGKKIGYIYFDAGFGKEPLPFLQQLQKDYGFETKLYPVAAAEMQNQSAQWLNVRRDKPDYMIMYGWGAMQPTAIKEAVKVGYPMEKFVSIWWPNEDDAKGAGEGANGFKTLNWHAATPTSGHRGHPEVRRRQGQEPGRPRTRSARCSTTAASTIRC